MSDPGREPKEHDWSCPLDCGCNFKKREPLAEDEPAQSADPLEEAMRAYEAIPTPRGAVTRLGRTFIAMRVLKRGHGPVDLHGGGWMCRCEGAWPCAVLAEAAKALKGE